MKTIAPNLNIEHVIETTPQVVGRLVASLDDFAKIAPDLEPLNSSGGNKHSIVTDGEWAVLVNAEGYDYPRYRGPRMAVELLKNIWPRTADAICTRKSFWPENYTVETPEQLDELQAKPWAVCE